MKTYPVIEIFDSIQGEGCMIGMPVTFVRFAGCNLSCPWCDSKETWGASDKIQMMTAEEITDKCNQTIVVLTGGEPLLQPLDELLTALHEWEHMICCETNGTQPTPEDIDWVVASPKPQSNYELHAECKYDELKYVVDENFDVTVIPEKMWETTGQVWLQPCDYGHPTDSNPDALEKSRASMARVVELPLQFPYLRAGIQLHKILGVR